MRQSASSKRLWAALGILATAAILLRQAGQRNWSYWLDEAMQVSYVRGSLRDLWVAVRFDGVHPPLDYLVTWAAYHLGDGREPVLRLMPSLWMTLAAVLAFLLSGGVERPARSLAAGLFLLGTPLGIYLGQEIRPYALAILLVTLVATLLEPVATLTRRRLAWASVASTLAVLTLYLTAVPLAVLWGSVLWHARSRRALFLETLLASGLPAATLGGWLWLVRASIARHEERFPVDLSLSGLGSLANGLLAWREECPRLLAGAVLPAVLIGLGLFATSRRRSWRQPALLLATTLGVVALLALAQHWIDVRYLALALVPCGVLFGEGVDFVLPDRPRTRAALLGLFLALHTPAYLENLRSARPNWRQVATYLSFQDGVGVRGDIYGLDDWSYLCLRAQPLVAARVKGSVTEANASEALRGEGWLVRTPHYRGAADPDRLVGETRPWARSPEAEDARVYRFRDGKVVPP